MYRTEHREKDRSLLKVVFLKMFFVTFFSFAYDGRVGSISGAILVRFWCPNRIKIRTCRFLFFIDFLQEFQHFLIFLRVRISSSFASFFVPLFDHFFETQAGEETQAAECSEPASQRASGPVNNEKQETTVESEGYEKKERDD